MKTTNNKYRILHLEDLESDAELVKRQLEKSGLDFECLLVDTEAEYRKGLIEFKPDVVLCDHSLPAFNSFEALKILNHNDHEIPFILITAYLSDETAVQLVKQGASDYILKDRLTRLPYALINAVEKSHYEKERKDMMSDVFEKELLAKVQLSDITNRLLLATGVARIGIWEYDIASEKFSIDDIEASLYGMTKQDFDGSHANFFSLIHPDDKERVQQNFFSLLQNKNELNAEFRIVWPDGSVHFIKSFGVVQRNADGKALNIIGTNQDITESKEKEKLLSESEARYRAFFENSLDGILLNDATGRILDANPAACKILDRSKEEVCRMGRAGILDDSDPAFKKLISERDVNGSARAELVFKRKGQFKFHVEVSSAKFLNSSGEPRISTIFRDITERKHSESILIQYQQQLLESQRIANIGSWQFTLANTHNIRSNTIICSDETNRLFGFPKAQRHVTYEQFVRFIYPEDKKSVIRCLREALNDRATCKQEFRIKDLEGKIKWVYQEVKVEQNANGTEPLKMFGIIKDITVRKRQEVLIEKNTKEREILIQELQESLEDLKQFSFITSHNFTSPLSNLKGLLSLFDYDSLNELNMGIVDMFTASILQMDKTINDLTEILIIKSSKVKVENLDLAKTITDTCDILRNEIEESGCILSVDLSAESVRFNKTYLESVLMNVIGNALKYRSPERALVVKIAAKRISAQETVISVADNGIGFDLNMHKDRIFGLYQRFHESSNGKGLGLYIVKTQMKTLGGDISVDSAVDGGSRFTLHFKHQNDELESAAHSS